VAGGDGENAIFPAPTSTHHLILHELMGHVRHLRQSVSEPLSLRFPSRSREPAGHVSHCTVHPGPREREIRSMPLAVGRREKGGLQRGTMSTRKAPGSTSSENWLMATSTMSTVGSSYSLTAYPWEIIKMTAPAVLKVRVCQKRWICQTWDQKLKFARHDAKPMRVSSD